MLLRRFNPFLKNESLVTESLLESEYPSLFIENWNVHQMLRRAQQQLCPTQSHLLYSKYYPNFLTIIKNKIAIRNKVKIEKENTLGHLAIIAPEEKNFLFPVSSVQY